MITNVLFGMAGGLLTASWGAFKDSPYENFSYRSFLRSIIITTGYYLFFVTTFQHSRYFFQESVMLFSAIALERITQEYYKAFFRQQARPDIYKIPQPLHIFGKVVSRQKRVIAGLIITVITTLTMVILSHIKYVENSWILPLLLFALIPTLGGAWKDAPIEGFEISKFPRSFLVMLASASALHNLTDNLLILTLGSAGLERVLVEFYKTFISRSTPGKFITIIKYPGWIKNRSIFITSYFLAIALLIYLWR